MKVAVVSKWRRRIRRELRALGLETTRLRPDVVACVGGDGTLLLAEQKFPGVPKIFIYHKCREKCNHSPLNRFWKKLKAKDYLIIGALKLEARVKGRVLYAINDVNIHYMPPQAIGLLVSIGTRKKECLGDGAVISTPFGSAAYFKAITRRTFSRGVGVAFNHPIKLTAPFVARESDTITVRVTRGRGVVACDANLRLVRVKPGDKITIKRTRPAWFIQLKGLSFKINTM